MNPPRTLHLRHGPLSRQTAHLSLDMQNLFAEETAWKTPWMARVLPMVTSIATHRPERTIFTRFIPPRYPEEAPGVWRRYYERWHQFTQAEADPHLFQLVPELAKFVPPAKVVDKSVYSPFHGQALLRILQTWEIDTLIVTGAETDVCVGASVFAAMDYGFRVILVRDAVCGSADETHDALMKVYADRFSQQVELVDAAVVLRHWQ